MIKIAMFTNMMFFSLGLFAQGKVFLEPYLGFFIGYSRENKSINEKQSVIHHNNFGRKDITFGSKISYRTNKQNFSIGYEKSFYTSSFKHIEKGFPKINSYYSWSSIYFHSLYSEYSRQLIDVNVRLPRAFKRWINSKNNIPYLLTSKISPVLGLEYRFSNKSYENDYNDPHATIGTSQGDYVADIEYLHLRSKANVTMRGGLNWEFYNGERHKFTLTLLYKFAFKDAGYVQYHFKSVNNINPEFDYQNTTRGNGFCIYLGVPIKLHTFKKK